MIDSSTPKPRPEKTKSNRKSQPASKENQVKLSDIFTKTTNFKRRKSHADKTTKESNPLENKLLTNALSDRR